MSEKNINKNEENWLAKFEQLKKHVSTTGHFPNKHCTLSHFVKYTRKKINEGTLEEWKRDLFTELANSRSSAHTGGRKKKTV